eukprot:TRINITY_DN3691_c0_g1_i4.p1 TRINITY_DN3691_c0_g1~~TRINITY_DN3691_c0_g1_i4.p1  ORF type:complete len:227 (+),score=37.83 TRINITY_DN3691_c0_g1_i4:139-819(+)
MTFLHFVNCAALLIAPAFVIYYATRLSDLRASMAVGYGALAYAASQSIKLLLLATFVPTLSTSTSFDLVQEVFKVVVSWLDLCIFAYVLNKVPGVNHNERVLGVGLGWGAAEGVVHKLVPLWVHARAPQWDWANLRSAMEANVNIVQAISLAEILSGYLTGKRGPQTPPYRDAHLLTIAVYTLFSGIGKGLLSGHGWICLFFHVACVAALWVMANRLSTQKNAKSK